MAWQEQRGVREGRRRERGVCLCPQGKHTFARARYDRLLRMMESTRDWNTDVSPPLTSTPRAGRAARSARSARSMLITLITQRAQRAALRDAGTGARQGERSRGRPSSLCVLAGRQARWCGAAPDAG